MGAVTIFRMPTDILPEIDIPVVTVIWTFPGLPAEDMERRIVTLAERAFTTTVNDIEHMESQSMNGVGLIKIYFHEGAKIEAAVAQVTSVSPAAMRFMPPGLIPPIILRYSAASVPILQLGVSSKSLSEQELYDYGNAFLRVQLATVQGASVPLPYGGKPRQIMVDLNTDSLLANGLSATDVINAVNAQNLILPAGTVKIGAREYNVRLNSSPEEVDALNDLPIKHVNGATIYLRDVAHVRDGFAVQTNVVRQNQRRSSLLTVLKNGAVSTLQIVDRMKAALPKVLATLPPELDVRELFDQSRFVRASIRDVIFASSVAALLTSSMILLFLGSLRSTVIVAISIPLSILCSIITMNFFDLTLNLMTLGGLALAVGILVDDATVEVENIHRNLSQGKHLEQAILDGAQQIAVPAFVSSVAICIVFVPVLFLTGAAKSLFTPLAFAVVCAVMASYLLSRTLVPTMAKYLLRTELHRYEGGAKESGAGLFQRFYRGFNLSFIKLRESYCDALGWALEHRVAVLAAFVSFFAVSLALLPWIGQDFFPRVDAGEFRLHVRAPAGTRIEETERIFDEVEGAIRQIIPQNQIELILDNIGLPFGGINLAFSDSATVGSSDGEILVDLREGPQGRTWQYVKQLRKELPARFPDLLFFFQPSDMVNQIVNFGVPVPIDIQVVGRNKKVNYEIARQIEKRVAQIPGAVDVHIHQVVDAPELFVEVDRTRALEMGLTQKDVANTLLFSLASSVQAATNLWLNPATGVSYFLAVQTPQHKIDSIDALQSTPLVPGGSRSPQLLGNVANVQRALTTLVVNHYNVQPVFDVYANVQDRDLGGVANDIDQVLAELQSKLPRGTTTEIRGQVERMRSSFAGLQTALIFAVALVYLLMVVNFQSWLDPVIILMSIPGALCGVLWMLFVTQTTFTVTSLMGGVMSIGVATANSILLVSFANEQRFEGKDAGSAALAAGYTRLRPVLMTALAMILGMLPMALGAGEGGEQNAPLGRAVIGGLVVATAATLFLVPVFYAILRKTPKQSMKESHT